MGLIAHAKMLSRVGVLTADECQQIETGLREIQQEIENGALQWSIALEDVHMNVETCLIQKLAISARNYTPGALNDQVATDIRLYFRKPRN